MGGQDFLYNHYQQEKLKQKPVWQSLLLLPFRILPVFLFWLLIGAIILAIVLGLAMIPYFQSFNTILKESLAGKENLQAAQIYISQRDFDLAKDKLVQARLNFSSAQEMLGDLETRAIFKVPVINSQMQIAQDVLYIGENVSDSLVQIAVLGDEVLGITENEDLSFADLTVEKKELVLQTLIDLGPQINESSQNIKKIQEQWNGLFFKRNLLLWRPVIQPLQEVLPDILKVYDYLVIASDALPDFIGYPEEKTYLFLMQNNDEIRPAGGFIGTYGIIKVKSAELTEFYTDGIYNLDINAVNQGIQIEPPYPISKYMNVKYWYMRDANWWPDFETSAKNVEKFYHLEGGDEKNLDGVIAITPYLIEDLLKLVGPITVDGITFTSENFTDQLQEYVEFGFYKKGLDVSERKDIIGDMAQVLQTRLFNLPVEEWEDLLDIVKNNLDEKQMLGYFDSDSLQSFLEEKNWAGTVIQTDEDYIQVVDANLAALKTDRDMERELKYELWTSDKDLIGKVTVNYIHHGYFTALTSRYRSYTRLYVPKGSELLEVTAGRQKFDLADIDTYNEFDKTAFGVFFEVEPQQSKTVTFIYKLPKEILKQMNDGDYKLLIQKQAGIPQMNLELNLQFPDNKTVFGRDNNQIQSFDLIKKDQWYTVLFE